MDDLANIAKYFVVFARSDQRQDRIRSKDQDVARTKQDTLPVGSDRIGSLLKSDRPKYVDPIGCMSIDRQTYYHRIAGYVVGIDTTT